MRILVLLAISLNVVYSTAAGIPFNGNEELEGWPVCDVSRVTWHAHPYSCTRYVICFHGNIIERLCAPGLHYNRIMEQCQPPQLARCDINYACPPVDDKLNPVFLPDESDCSRYFVCFEGSPIARECATDLWWDVVYNWCTFADQVTCDEKAPNNPNNPTTPPATIPTTPPTLPPTTKPPPVQVTTPSTTTTTQDPNTYDCPLSSEPSFHPHSRDCELYFICINGVAFLRQCAAGLWFDITHRECNDRDIANCISGSVIVPGEKSPALPFDCPLGDYEVLFYPHQTKCERFFECRKGIAYLKFCPSGEHYDVPSEICEAKSKALCLNDISA